jgi:hypothetical protein
MLLTKLARSNDEAGEVRPRPYIWIVKLFERSLTDGSEFYETTVGAMPCIAQKIRSNFFPAAAFRRIHYIDSELN